MDDLTTEEKVAGAGPNFQGHVQPAKNSKRTAGVIEGRPGIIKSIHIDPLTRDGASGQQCTTLSARTTCYNFREPRTCILQKETNGRTLG